MAHIALGQGVTLLDTGFVRPGVVASYLLQHGARAALIEAGTANTAPHLLQALADCGVARDAVDYVVVTHVHLDHGGGAGALMAALPRAKLIVHPRGARHMIDPSRLIAGAAQVYGRERLLAVFGLPEPIAAERVESAGDGFTFALAGRPLRVLDTPGHALHHFVVYDETSLGVFAGDTFGLSYAPLCGPGVAFVFPTTTPVQFDPQALHASVQRIAELAPQRIYFTHFGMLEGGAAVAAAAVDLHRLIDDYASLAQGHASASTRHATLIEAMMALLQGELTQRGCALAPQAQRALLEMDVELNVQGLEVWLDRRE